MNENTAQPGRYVLAVSGGIDSVVLLHIMVRLLAGRSDVHMVVAHYDHGIRAESGDDRQFVAALAQQYGLPFEYDEGRLGAGVSEAVAREARYAFLRDIKSRYDARYIVTAHHEDDVLETAVLNLLRGTGRRGLSSLRSTHDIYRPLLTTPKRHVRIYAHKHGLEWREDSTNSDTEYLRNYVRLYIMPRFDGEGRQRLKQILELARQHNQSIDGLLAAQLRLQPADDCLDRQWFIMLPHAVAREAMAAWLRSFGITSFDRRLLERLTVAAKTYQPGKRIDVNSQWQITVGRNDIVLGPTTSSSNYRG